MALYHPAATYATGTRPLLSMRDVAGARKDDEGPLYSSPTGRKFSAIEVVPTELLANICSYLDPFEFTRLAASGIVVWCTLHVESDENKAILRRQLLQLVKESMDGGLGGYREAAQATAAQHDVLFRCFRSESCDDLWTSGSGRRAFSSAQKAAKAKALAKVTSRDIEEEMRDIPVHPGVPLECPPTVRGMWGALSRKMHTLYRDSMHSFLVDTKRDLGKTVPIDRIVELVGRMLGEHQHCSPLSAIPHTREVYPSRTFRCPHLTCSYATRSPLAFTKHARLSRYTHVASVRGKVDLTAKRMEEFIRDALGDAGVIGAIARLAGRSRNSSPSANPAVESPPASGAADPVPSPGIAGKGEAVEGTSRPDGGRDRPIAAREEKDKREDDGTDEGSEDDESSFSSVSSDDEDDGIDTDFNSDSDGDGEKEDHVVGMSDDHRPAPKRRRTVQYFCPFCDGRKPFSAAHRRNVHVRDSHGAFYLVASHRCTKCGYAASTSKELKAHDYRIHVDPVERTCTQPGCEYVAVSRPLLWSHTVDVHQIVPDAPVGARPRKVFRCQRCNVIRSSSDAFASHFRAHEREDRREAIMERDEAKRAAAAHRRERECQVINPFRFIGRKRLHPGSQAVEQLEHQLMLRMQAHQPLAPSSSSSSSSSSRNFPQPAPPGPAVPTADPPEVSSSSRASVMADEAEPSDRPTASE